MSNWESEFGKILEKIISKKDSEAFKEPVNWEYLGIPDYPEIIKHPMDLGTVKRKLVNGEYRNQEDAASDVRLIWMNALTYNAPGSRIYVTAKSLSDQWESQWHSVMKGKDDADRPATKDELLAWVDMCHRISSEDLGRVLVQLENLCPQSLVKKGELNEVEVNVDLIPGKIFRDMVAFVVRCFPATDDILSEGTRRSKLLKTRESSDVGNVGHEKNILKMQPPAGMLLHPIPKKEKRSK